MKQNKKIIDLEWMYCPKCKHTSGHALSTFWTCIDCGFELGKKLSLFQKVIKKLFI